MASNPPPTRLVANIKSDGTVTYYNLLVNSNGTVTRGAIFDPNNP